MSSPEGRDFEGLPRVTRRTDSKVFRIVAQARSPDGPVDLFAVDGPPFEQTTVNGFAFVRDFIDPRKEAAPARSDPMAAPHVDVSMPAFGGSIRLHSASGGLESLWISVRDPQGAEVTYDRATRQHVAAPVRLTPADARTLSDLLRRYADTHKETSDAR